MGLSWGLFGSNWVELGRIGLGWVGLGLVRSSWVGLGWFGSGWVESSRIGSGRIGLDRVWSGLVQKTQPKKKHKKKPVKTQPKVCFLGFSFFLRRHTMVYKTLGDRLRLYSCILRGPSREFGSKGCIFSYFFIGENLSLGFGRSHVRRLWACTQPSHVSGKSI